MAHSTKLALLDFWNYRHYFVTRLLETSHRQAKQFKKAIYITFSEYSIGLKLIDEEINKRMTNIQTTAQPQSK
jgi:hypothetical protein